MKKSKATPSELADPGSPWMNKALRLAKQAYRKSEVPVGALIVCDGKQISSGYNLREKKQDPTAHAEMICLRKLGYLKSADFRKAVLYTTLSPCWMCAGTIIMLGIKQVVIGDNTTFKGPEDILKSNGVQIFNLESKICIDLMRRFQK
ncbi:MAG: nucleoside deaminase, partial [Bdellovibrionota bacterium]